jgi:hypothetical protein
MKHVKKRGNRSCTMKKCVKYSWRRVMVKYKWRERERMCKECSDDVECKT